MRHQRIIQASLFENFAEHEIGRELEAMSQLLDRHRDLIDLVMKDLRGREVRPTGRVGLPAETVLRCALLKQYRQLSYEELAFHLEDSASFIAFARLPLGWSPKKSVLHKTISAIRAQTWETINRTLIRHARQEKLEDGAVARIDSTVTEALMHEPSDNSLLWDAVRVMVRLLKQAAELPGGTRIVWRNHRRLAKKRAHAIQYCRGEKLRAKLYRDLIRATRATVAALEQARQRLARYITIEVTAWRSEVEHYLPLIARLIDQTERRVFAGLTVPASEKLVSLFEPHADIIVKGGRKVQYGHKLNLTTGRTGLILDVVVESGNPADAQRCLPMLERHAELYGAVPRQAACDGGYASATNLAQAKAMGVEDMAFHKKCHLAVEDMVRSQWVYRKLRNFRAGIEANISCLKRAYGLARCTWRGVAHFQAYVWSAVVAYNMALIARLTT
jgi:IS5 family transposase